jgi:hypothetical protein
MLVLVLFGSICSLPDGATGSTALDESTWEPRRWAARGFSSGMPASRPAGALIDSPQKRLPLGLPDASDGQASLSADLER